MKTFKKAVSLLLSIAVIVPILSIGIVPASASVSLEGKKAIFIGNSFVYYGGVVQTGSQKKQDYGWFHLISQANGENCTVYDCTYGSHHLYDFTSAGCKSGSCHSGADLLKGVPLSSIDYVFMSEAGENNSSFVSDVKKVMKRFTGSQTKFYYLSHSYTYSKNHTNIINKLPDLRDLGITIIEWGKLVDDIIDSRVSVPGATVTYKKTSFIKNSGDTFHPNPLAGYITAQMAYCVVSGKTAVGQMPNLYSIGDTVKYGKSVTGYSAYISTHYTSSSSTNFKAIMKSTADMKGIQTLIDKYIKKWVTYTIKFNNNAGTGTMSETTRDKGASSALPANTFTNGKYKFKGWTAKRNSDQTWLYVSSNQKQSGWYVDGSQPQGYTKYIYADKAVVGDQTLIDKDIISMKAVWGVLCGDIDGSGIVNISDVTNIQKAIASITSKSSLDLEVADVDGDGKITLRDATYIQLYVGKRLTAFPADIVPSSTTAKSATSENIYYTACASSYETIIEGLNSIGVDSSYEFRKQIAAKNNISNYSGTAEQNTQMLNLLKQGKLIKV